MIPRTPQKARSKAVSLPAPVGGWNARDSLGEMDKSDAVALVNIFPGTTTCHVRRGYLQWATGLLGQVETVMSYSGSTVDKLFGIATNAAGTGGTVYNISASGAVGAAVLSGLTNARWQYTNISTAGGNFIIMCNGADNVYTYDGTNWTDRGGAITGVTSSTLTNVCLHKNRPWFTQAGTLKAWYFPVQSITGAANALDLSAFCPHGGYLMAIGTWTMDAGYGVDDMIVFITNNGDCLVYRGTDPTSASTWALVGVFWIGAPVGRRCMVKYKGDLLIITQDGVVPLSGALQSSRLNPRVAITNKIENATSDAVSSYGSNFGWQLLPYPAQNMLILNVPVMAGSAQQQYVMNTITGAWCNFTGWQANCWELHQNEIYFGGTGYVGKAWNTLSDNVAAIPADGFQAFNYFGARGQLKRFTMMRPTLYTNGAPSIQGAINIDFDKTTPISNLSTVAVTGGAWDSGVWDTALWGDDNFLTNGWQGATGVGYCGAPRLISSTNGVSLEWVSTDVVMEPGAIL